MLAWSPVPSLSNLVALGTKESGGAGVSTGERERGRERKRELPTPPRHFQPPHPHHGTARRYTQFDNYGGELEIHALDWTDASTKSTIAGSGGLPGHPSPLVPLFPARPAAACRFDRSHASPTVPSC